MAVVVVIVFSCSVIDAAALHAVRASVSQKPVVIIPIVIVVIAATPSTDPISDVTLAWCLTHRSSSAYVRYDHCIPRCRRVAI
jgi:hypothetical protein